MLRRVLASIFTLTVLGLAGVAQAGDIARFGRATRDPQDVDVGQAVPLVVGGLASPGSHTAMPVTWTLAAASR